MNDAQERADTAEAQASTLQGHLSTRAVAMYKNGSSSLIDVLFGSSTFTEFTSNWDFLQSMNTSDAESITELQAAKEEAASAREEYAVQEQEAQAKLDEAEQIKNDAEALVADKQSVYDSLSAEAAALVQQEAAADATTYGGATAGSYDSVGGSNAVERAYSYVGNASYAWGACSPGVFDCSGFVSYCLTGEYSRLGTTYTFLGWPEVSDPQPGDVAVNEDHCGIYIGNGQMIHCATFGVGVIIGPVQSGMSYHRY